jgi:hypothetical protein
MTGGMRHDRTVRLLTARLEEIAVASERAPGRERALEPSILGAAAATRHAVELQLLSAEEAGEIWEAVARRHPGAGWARHGPLRAA